MGLGSKGLGRLAGSGRRLEQLPQLTQHRFHQLLLVSLALFQDGKHGPLVSLTQPVKRATKKRKVMNGQGRLRQFKLLFQNGDGSLGRNTQVFAGVLTVNRESKLTSPRTATNPAAGAGPEMKTTRSRPRTPGPVRKPKILTTHREHVLSIRISFHHFYGIYFSTFL